MAFSRPMGALCLAALVLAPSVASAQHSQKREGFWFNVGVASGSLGCNECGTRVSGSSGSLALGGTLNQQWLLGVFANGWTKSQYGATMSTEAFVLGVRFYPSAQGGFFLHGGIGSSRIDLSAYGFGSASVSGSSAQVGLGYDIRVADNVSLTPFLNSIAMSFAGGDANVTQLGIGITVH